LQILEDGQLTDAQGRKVNFRNTIIIMTSNVGARLITEKQQLGFAGANQEQDSKRLKETVLGELKKAFRPEFLNRIDDIIVFNKLTHHDVEQIAQHLLNALKDLVKSLGFEISFTQEAIKEISKKGFDPTYGARPLRRAITAKIEDKLSEQILEKKFAENSNILCDFNNGEFVFNI
jgi:ATP-dependent Clp protease ATP-binding subunit ClpC